MTYQEAANEIRRVVHAEQLSPVQAQVLEVLALDDYGFQLTAAPSILAASINRPAEECLEALTELTSADLVLKISDQYHSRVVANYARLGVTEEMRQALRLGHPTPFEQLDAPHSAEAMATLHTLFVEEPRPIYLGLEITSHRVFQKLEERALAGHMTVFIMPHRSLVAQEQKRHYDDILRGWIQFLRDLSRPARQNIRLCIARVPRRYLYTSALTPQFVRFDCYWYDQGTTRRGVMVKATKGSSLYDLVQREYSETVDASAPLLRVWPWAWTKHVAVRFAPLLVTATLLVVAFVLDKSVGTGSSLAKYVAVFLVGLAGESLWDMQRSRPRAPRGLYGS